MNVFGMGKFGADNESNFRGMYTCHAYTTQGMHVL